MMRQRRTNSIRQRQPNLGRQYRRQPGDGQSDGKIARSPPTMFIVVHSGVRSGIPSTLQRRRLACRKAQPGRDDGKWAVC